MAPRRTVAAVGAAAVACLVLGASAQGLPCTFDSGRGATFDLSAMTKTSGDYRVRDRFADSGRNNYDYYFNVCDNLKDTPVPPQHHDGSAVPAEESACLLENKMPTPGLQVANWWNGCYQLGADVHSQHGSNITFALLDQNQPHKGVTLTYAFGQPCGDYNSELQYRELVLAFQCVDDTMASFEDDEPEFIEETETCHYEIFLPTAYGCPKECPITDGHVCGGHGVCGYDFVGSTAMCMCNEGYTGTTCTDVVSLDSGGGIDGTGVVLIIMVVILGLIIGAVVFMWYKLRRLNVDPNSFTELKGLYNELGQIA
mmetsp:Transcript_25494/g.60136  ORF Transcript_25494/g.60136 Transcript_25494/m.60136 type:complete len:313 (-) Transcript_25494:72-1010(-)